MNWIEVPTLPMVREIEALPPPPLPEWQLGAPLHFSWSILLSVPHPNKEKNNTKHVIYTLFYLV